MQDLFNVYADTVIIKATEFETYPDFDDAPVIIPIPEPETIPWWDIARNVAVGIVAVVVVVAFIATLPVSGPIAVAAAGGAAIGAVVLGGAVIVSNTIEDIQSSRLRQLKNRI